MTPRTRAQNQLTLNRPPNADPAEPPSSPSPLEATKATSGHLRGTLSEELGTDAEAFSKDAGQLLKFHGIYQQDDRDLRRELVRSKQKPAYSCMVRCSVPGGVLSADQWFEIDRLADEVGDGHLRLTTRQGVQYHFVAKHDLRTLIEQLNRGLVTTYAACGDVVRNVMVTSAPNEDRDIDRLNSLATALSQRFQPQSSAYWELWLDGERAVSSVHEPTVDLTNPSAAEPIYGDTYLPRKFKVGIAWPGDNSIDVYSQDVGLVLVAQPDGTPGAVLLAGGGLGRSHRDPTTFPRLAEPLGWVPDGDIPSVVEAIVKTFRDEGDRNDRSHARLKYLVEERGIDWLRSEVERRTAKPLADPISLPAWGGARDHLGWNRQQSGTWYLGLPVPGGRLGDDGVIRRRTAIREVLDRFADEVRITPHQDLLLCGIANSDKAAVEALLAEHGVPRVEHLSLTVVSSMACPALPTCGQALGEAERVLPTVTDLIDQLLVERDLAEVSIETRMTGCPNGCSRPYVAELGIVARSKTAYDIFVGGDPAGTRLASILVESVRLTNLGAVLAVVLDRYRAERSADEPFGDWAFRVGVDVLAEFLSKATGMAPSEAETAQLVNNLDERAER